MALKVKLYNIITNTLLITAEWNTNNTGNSIYSETFILNKIY
jgi:hypothetical protein